MRTLSTAARQGMTAKAEGKPVTMNPYRAGCQESADWLEGYTNDEWQRFGKQPRMGHE